MHAVLPQERKQVGHQLGGVGVLPAAVDRVVSGDEEPGRLPLGRLGRQFQTITAAQLDTHLLKDRLDKLELVGYSPVLLLG